MFIVHDPFLKEYRKLLLFLEEWVKRLVTTTWEAHGTGKKRVEQGNERRPISGMHETRVHLHG